MIYELALLTACIVISTAVGYICFAFGSDKGYHIGLTEGWRQAHTFYTKRNPTNGPK